ncbi:hypothetical protein JHK87_010224 [Glycine soja]|nr:hypothetical protein JHK87_010224 [Glycine soja]
MRSIPLGTSVSPTPINTSKLSPFSDNFKKPTTFPSWGSTPPREFSLSQSAKASEAVALGKLKTLTESTIRERALTAQHSSMITISKFEYEYLTNHVASVEEIADKKVAATEAWIEALKANEKEILMETKIAQRQLKESKLEQELEVYTKEKMLSRRVSGSGELDNWPRKREKSSSKNFIV